MENKKSMLFGSVLLGGILLFSVYGIGSSIASGNYEHESEEHEYENNRHASQPQGISQSNAQYVEECGSCHMAYPARLLPAESWSKVMNGLHDHFGENAELNENTRKSIQSYLVSSASAQGQYRKMLRNLGNESPLRITELPYFIRKHDEIPSRYIKGNEKVSSLSQCNACHRGAEKGRFDEDEVVIPGVGRWHD